MRKPLVSVIIPCYNAQPWLTEAIQSSLNQTYRLIEIIVIDDGSSDGSLNLIKSFGNVIRWETGPNYGGNAARNRGIRLSKGDYLQFLDADDYLLPEKIERQVEFLQQTGVDGVYGDWCLQYDPLPGRGLSKKQVIAGHQDVINELLSNEWWVSPNALLWSRAVVLAVCGWDERVYVGQDRDFFLSVALSGATISYQPGCFSVYRRHGKGTVSTSNPSGSLASHCLILEKAEETLRRLNRFSLKYQYAMAHGYFKLARAYYDLDYPKYQVLMKKVLTLNPNYQPQVSPLYNLLQRMFGFAVADFLASYRRRVVKHYKNFFAS